MSATVRGDLSAYLASLAAQLEPKVARGALRAGANVIADLARENCRSKEVAESIGVSTRTKPGVITATVRTKGEGAYLAPWLEHGTDPHFISVDDDQRGGRTVRRINRLTREGSLVIGGNFVGKSVLHPGAKPYPFMRPAADQGQAPAIEAIGSYIAKRMAKGGMDAPAEPEATDE